MKVPRPHGTGEPGYSPGPRLQGPPPHGNPNVHSFLKVFSQAYSRNSLSTHVLSIFCEQGWAGQTKERVPSLMAQGPAWRVGLCSQLSRARCCSQCLADRYSLNSFDSLSSWVVIVSSSAFYRQGNPERVRLNKLPKCAKLDRGSHERNPAVQGYAGCAGGSSAVERWV